MCPCLLFLGCAMSSLAMYLTSRGHSETPGSLNKWLTAHNGILTILAILSVYLISLTLPCPCIFFLCFVVSKSKILLLPGYASGDLLIWGSVDSTFGVSYQGQEQPSESVMAGKPIPPELQREKLADPHFVLKLHLSILHSPTLFCSWPGKVSRSDRQRSERRTLGSADRVSRKRSV